jgi:hypothetical protein
MKKRLLLLMLINVVIIADSYSQWVKSNIPTNENVSSIIPYNNGLLASTTYQIKENQYCKIYQSADCGDTWTEIYKTQLFKYLEMFTYMETVYFWDYNNNRTITIYSTSDNFKTISSKEIPELWTRKVYDFYVFNKSKILFAYNKGIGIYEQGIFQAVNLSKFGKHTSSQIKFYDGNVFVDYGESILISRDTCRTWKKYFEFKSRDCGNEKDIYFFKVNGFDFLNKVLVVGRGNANCYGMYYCDTSKREVVKKIDIQNNTGDERPVVLGNIIYGMPHYEADSGIYYLNENFKQTFLHFGLPSNIRHQISINQMISCNKSILIGTSNGIYKLKK